MTAIHFYHLTTTPLERALPKLLEKAHSGGFRVLLTLSNDDQAEYINQLLWTYDPNSFLPHGSAKEAQAARQPILLASTQDNVNQANVLFITNGARAENIESYERIIDMFDGGNEETLQAARTRWKHYKDAGNELHYYQQTASGNWEKKAA